MEYMESALNRKQ